MYTPSVKAVPVTVPTVTRSLQAVPGNGSVRLTWAAPISNGGSPITGYTIVYAPSGGTWSSINVSAGVRSRVIAGLRSGTPYYFRVAAYNSVGRSPWTSSLMAIPIATPSVPRSVTATPGGYAVTVRWTAPASTGGAPIQAYTIVYAPTGGTWTSINVSASTRARTITGLRSGATYYFRVAAGNAAGLSAYTPSVKAVPFGLPTVPRSLQAVGGGGSVRLTWTTPISTGGSPINGYTMIYAPAGGTWTSINVSASTRAGTITGLRSGTTYYFRVSATNSFGRSPWTPSVKAVPLRGPTVYLTFDDGPSAAYTAQVLATLARFGAVRDVLRGRSRGVSRTAIGCPDGGGRSCHREPHVEPSRPHRAQ